MRWWEPIEWLITLVSGARSIFAPSPVGCGREGNEVKGRIWQAVRTRLVERARVRPYARGNASRIGNAAVELRNKTVATKTGAHPVRQ